MKNFQKLQTEHLKWSLETFGKKNTAISNVKHLKKEVKELLEALGKKKPHELQHEFADCFLLLIEAAGKCGINMKDLLNISVEKHKICKTRKWKKANKQGFSEHKEG